MEPRAFETAVVDEPIHRPDASANGTRVTFRNVMRIVVT
jgi:hypothetical protein